MEEEETGGKKLRDEYEDPNILKRKQNRNFSDLFGMKEYEKPQGNNDKIFPTTLGWKESEQLAKNSEPENLNSYDLKKRNWQSSLDNFDPGLYKFKPTYPPKPKTIEPQNAEYIAVFFCFLLKKFRFSSFQSF